MDTVKDLPAKLASLAHYMMPAIWIPFAEFPQLTSGKADRKSLSKLIEGLDPGLLKRFQEVMSTVTFGSEFTTAQTAEEEVLQEAWATVFERETHEISTSVAFQTLGGDSITAIDLVSACRRRGYKLLVADVMSNPTIRMQATRLTQQVSSNSTAPVLNTKYGFEDQVYSELKAAGVDRKAVEVIYPCLPGQAEFLTQGRTEHQFWQLMTVRKLPANFNLQRWTELLTKLTAKNQILRAIFLNVHSNEDPKWVQAILKEPIIDLDTILYCDEDEKNKIIDSLWESSFPPTSLLCSIVSSFPRSTSPWVFISNLIMVCMMAPSCASLTSKLLPWPKVCRHLLPQTLIKLSIFTMEPLFEKL